MRKAAGITDWPADVMRHTAISHYVRTHDSFADAAMQFGNSEQIIKAHYVSVTGVNSKDSAKFYALAPKKGSK